MRCVSIAGQTAQWGLKTCRTVVQENRLSAVPAARLTGPWQAVDDSLIGADVGLGLGGLPGPLRLDPQPADPDKVHRFQLVGLRKRLVRARTGGGVKTETHAPGTI